MRRAGGPRPARDPGSGSCRHRTIYVLAFDSPSGFMTATRCPHCQAMVEDASTFCATCGRRVAGWSAAPLGGEPVAPLAGGEEPTRGMEVTPSLLRAASLPASKKKKPAAAGPVETDSALMRA